MKLIDPLVIASIVLVVVVWAALHFSVAGQILDIIVIIFGIVTLGPMAYVAGEHLVVFAIKTIGATTEDDLDEAAKNLSEAISLIGVQVVMQLLLVKAPKVFRRDVGLEFGDIKSVTNPKRPVGEWFYKPKTKTKAFFPEEPNTLSKITIYGDIEYLSRLTGKLKDPAKLHERIHSILTPKFYPLRNLRLTLRWNSYLRSTLLMYLEETLAETIAQVGVYGVKNALVGIKFPIKEGYVTLGQLGTEVGGIFLGPVNVSGMYFRVYFSFGNQSNNNEFQTK